VAIPAAIGEVKTPQIIDINILIMKLINAVITPVIIAHLNCEFIKINYLLIEIIFITICFARSGLTVCGLPCGYLPRCADLGEAVQPEKCYGVENCLGCAQTPPALGQRFVGQH
jgi:hypothetical protein